VRVFVVKKGHALFVASANDIVRTNEGAVFKTQAFAFAQSVENNRVLGR